MGHVSIERAGGVRKLEVLSDWAYIRNRLTLTVFAEPTANRCCRRSGYTLSILRKEKDGRSLLVRDANLLAKTQD